MEIEIKINDEKFKKDIAALKTAIPDMVEKSLGYAAEFVRGRVQADYLRGPRPERLRVDTARLINSIQSATSRQGTEIKAFIGSNALSDTGFNYPRYWELSGSRHGGPRPFLWPAVEQNREKWVNLWITRLKGLMERWLSARQS